MKLTVLEDLLSTGDCSSPEKKGSEEESFVSVDPPPEPNPNPMAGAGALSLSAGASACCAAASSSTGKEIPRCSSSLSFSFSSSVPTHIHGRRYLHAPKNHRIRVQSPPVAASAQSQPPFEFEFELSPPPIDHDSAPLLLATDLTKSTGEQALDGWSVETSTTDDLAAIAALNGVAGRAIESCNWKHLNVSQRRKRAGQQLMVTYGKGEESPLCWLRTAGRGGRCWYAGVIEGGVWEKVLATVGILLLGVLTHAGGGRQWVLIGWELVEGAVVWTTGGGSIHREKDLVPDEVSPAAGELDACKAP